LAVALAAAMPRGLAQSAQRDPPAPLPDLGELSSVALSPQQERRIGEEAMREIRADPSYVDDPEVEDYLSGLGAALAANGPGARQDFQFFLLRDDTINAFAMPGGFVGVHTGLLLASQTESELASVLAHEISHVTQHHIARMFGQQSQMSTLGLAGLLLGILASRGNAQVGQAALMASQAGLVQAQLNYSRDYEREADRVGFDRLQQAGFDVNGMVTFFERLQRATRIYENNAPAYLQTHPLTGERIADIQNRAHNTPYKQHVDRPEFQLVRAKVKAEQGVPSEEVAYFDAQLRDKRYASEAAARYGLVTALIRARDFKRAETEIAALRAGVPAAGSPMVDVLAMRVKSATGDPKAAFDMGMAALARNANYRPLQYALVQTLQAQGQHDKALARLSDLVKTYPRDPRLYRMQSESYAATGRGLLQHQAQAEVYYLQGSVPAAIEQLQLAQKAGDGDFYQQSAVDARLREMRRNNDDDKEKRRR
ncbi:MAG TPA: M48 family metalloprotease, partial [Burkholderiales bacterium]|nr:M48 family metalloprotease [Burkholderiales bacterium]